MKRLLSYGALALLVLNMLTFVAAHEGTVSEEQSFFLHKSSSLTMLWIGTLIVIVGVATSLIWEKKGKTTFERAKPFLFWIIVIPAVVVSLYMIIQTVTINVLSDTKGPVHWHADYEVWACDEELDLIDPTGFSNRIGTPLFHEHNDNRIHLEGTIMSLSDVTLHRYFEVIGGTLEQNRLVFQTNDGQREFSNGDACPDGTGVVQVWVYKTNKETNTYSVEKLANFEEYVISPYEVVPPGDCFIVEFGPESPTTQKMCTTIRVAIEDGDISPA